VTAPGRTDQDDSGDEENGHKKAFAPKDRSSDNHGGDRDVETAGHQQFFKAGDAEDKLSEENYGKNQPNSQTNPGRVPSISHPVD
jgi:hypothetical protein